MKTVGFPLAASADIDVLASVMTATIHTIAVRARAQVPRQQLERIVNGAIELVCGAEPAKK